MIEHPINKEDINENGFYWIYDPTRVSSRIVYLTDAIRCFMVGELGSTSVSEIKYYDHCTFYGPLRVPSK